MFIVLIADSDGSNCNRKRKRSAGPSDVKENARKRHKKNNKVEVKTPEPAAHQPIVTVDDIHIGFYTAANQRGPQPRASTVTTTIGGRLRKKRQLERAMAALHGTTIVVSDSDSENADVGKEK